DGWEEVCKEARRVETTRCDDARRKYRCGTGRSEVTDGVLRATEERWATAGPVTRGSEGTREGTRAIPAPSAEDPDAPVGGPRGPDGANRARGRCCPDGYECLAEAALPLR